MQNTSKPRIAVLDFQELGFQDQRSIPGAGRLTAERLATLLGESARYRVVGRAEWIRRMTVQNLGQVAGTELSLECRFHPAWAAERLAPLELDAVVIGRLKRSPEDLVSLSARLVDRSGTVLRIGGPSPEKLSRSLTARGIAGSIRLRRLPSEARVECVRASTVMLRVAGELRLRPKDRVRIDRTIESVPDPYLENDLNAFAYLTASVGEAEIVDVGRHFVLARYSGNSVPVYGDSVTLNKL